LIDFRYLLTTIVAIFLALAIGLLAGSGLGADWLDKQNERQVEELIDRNDELRGRNLEQRALLDAQQTFGLQIEPLLIDGELAGDQIVMVRFEGTDGSLVDRLQEAIEVADGAVVTTITIDDRMSMTDPASVDELLADLRVVFAQGEEDPTLLVGREMGARMASDASGATQEPSFGGIQDVLAEHGFIDVETDRVVPVPAGAEFVVAAGSDGESPFEIGPFAEALLSELSNGTDVVAAEGWESDWGFVPDLRGSDVRQDVATVDHGDTVAGSVSAVIELDRIPSNEPGHYGFREGADGIAPDSLPGG
jgi:hypothetical protein